MVPFKLFLSYHCVSRRSETKYLSIGFHISPGSAMCHGIIRLYRKCNHSVYA